MPSVIIPPTDVYPYTGTGDQVLATNPTFPGIITVSGTGTSSIAGNLNITGLLAAHQTAALNLAYEGSSLSQLVAYGANASTYGRINLVLRKAGTGVGAVTALSLTDTTATLGGNLTVSGGLNLTSSTTNSYIYDGTGWVWTSNGLSSGTVKGGIYTAGGSLFLTANSSLATNRFSLDSNGNATVAGNLTVSGSSESLFGNNGNQQLGVRIRNTTDGSNSAAYVALQSDVGFLTIYQTATSSTLGGNPTRYPASTSLFDSTSSGGFQWNAGAAKAMTLGAGGNLSIVGNLAVSGNINPFTIGPGYTGFAGSIGVLGGNGLFIQGKTGTTYDFAVGNNAGSVAFGIPAGTTNVSVVGNVLVGTAVNGTGKLQSTGLLYTSQTGASGGAPTNMGVFIGTSVTGSTDGLGLGSNGASGYKVIQSYSGALSINPSGNNVLFGGTIDSGNGQIQLTDTSANASKGLGFGSDCQIYRAGGNTLKMVLGPGSIWFDNGGSGTGGARILGSSGALTLTSNGGSSLYLQTGGAQALTLDTNQNATLAGNYFYVGGGTSFYLRATGSGNGIWYGNNVSVDANYFNVRDQAGSTSYLSVDSTGATFAGTTFKVTSSSSALASLVTSGSSAILNLVSNAQANYRSIAFSYGATPTGLWTIGYNGGTTDTQFNFQSQTGTVIQFTQAGDVTINGRSSAGTAYGTAKSVTVDYNVQTVTNVTRTFTVTMPSPSSGSTFLLEVGVYGNVGTGYSSLMVKGGGYLGNTSYYDATELVKVNSGSVLISSVTKSNGSMTFTVINTADVAICAVKFSQTSAAAFTTLPTITSA